MKILSAEWGCFRSQRSSGCPTVALPRRWGRRLLVTIFSTLALLSAASAWMIRNVLPYSIIRPSRSERWAVYGGRTPGDLGMGAEEFWTEAAPGVWLKGWFIRARAPGPGRGTVVLLHGSSSCKEALLGQAQMLTEQGYACLVYDSRAHGESGGPWATYGFYERTDFSRVLDEAARRFGGHGAAAGPGALAPVMAFGSSYGGAVALQAMAGDVRVRCAVVESAFADLRETVRDHGRLWLGLPAFMSDLALDRAGTLAGFDPDAVRPERDAARLGGRPVLLIHGMEDPRIPLACGKRVFNRLEVASPGSEWYPVPHGGHDDLWRAGGEIYRTRLLDFFARNARTPLP